MHPGFEDQAKIKGKEEFVLSEFRKLRDEIRSAFNKFNHDFLI